MVLSEISESEKQLVKDQLEVILASTYFNSAKQMQRFLEYIVEKTLAGEGRNLKQYTIGVEALAFPDDFDSDNNPGVRIMGGRVRSRLKEFYANTENYKIIIDIPKGTYAPQFSYPNTEVKESPFEGDYNEETYASSGPRLALLSYSDKTQNESSNKLLLQTADVIAEECSRFMLFKLIVNNPYADKSQSHGLGKDIDADYVLALYVQELPDEQYELICRFASTDSQEVLWSESFIVSNSIAMAYQEDVIRKIIADVVDIHQGRMQLHWARNLLLNKDSIRSEFKVLAYYRQYYDTFKSQTFADAITVCEVALQKNPNDVIASIIYSDLCRRDYVYAHDLVESALEKGIDTAEKVSHLRPDSCESHFVLGQLLYSQGNWERSLEQLRVARSISSYNIALQYAAGYYLCLMEKWDEGLDLVKKTIATSSSYPSWYHMGIFLHFFMQGKFNKALVEAQKIVAPNIPHGPIARCISYTELGETNKAKVEFIELRERIPQLAKDDRKTIYRMFGNENIADKICKVLEKIAIA